MCDASGLKTSLEISATAHDVLSVCTGKQGDLMELVFSIQFQHFWEQPNADNYRSQILQGDECCLEYIHTTVSTVLKGCMPWEGWSQTLCFAPMDGAPLLLTATALQLGLFSFRSCWLCWTTHHWMQTSCHTPVQGCLVKGKRKKAFGRSRYLASLLCWFKDLRKASTKMEKISLKDKQLEHSLSFFSSDCR